jgi:GR25 family glycosyltransferase involved in LPS biosynthesis
MACSYAMMKDLNHVIILEDDVDICDDFIERYDLMIKEMPKNWNHIYLGAITNKLGYKINDHIYRSMPSMGTHAYMIRKAIYKDFIREFSRLNGATDFIMSEMIRTNKLNSYSFIPFFAYQNTDFSIVQNEKIIGENDSLIFYKHKL